MVAVERKPTIGDARECNPSSVEEATAFGEWANVLVAYIGLGVDEGTYTFLNMVTWQNMIAGPGIWFVKYEGLNGDMVEGPFTPEQMAVRWGSPTA